MPDVKPKAFISYSWTSEEHQSFIRGLAERLVGDGVDVVMDVYDLREGHDKYAFMERMVTDSSVTHVLAFCDAVYSEKANARRAGVGTESQILSKEIYDKVEQSKIIPIVCQFHEDGRPAVPTFFGSRIWIDFSSDEAVNQNWERLIRLLYGKPLHQKPSLGSPPAYVQESAAAPPSPTAAKLATFRQAVLQGKPSIALYRRDLLDACIAHADSLRVRDRPPVGNTGAKVLEDCAKLVSVRDTIIDWALLESQGRPSEDFSREIVRFLERLLNLKGRPPEMNQWNDTWLEAHAVFVYETFLYVIAALLNTNSYQELHRIFAARYMVAQPYTEPKMESFAVFAGYSETLHEVLTVDNRRFYSPAAELIRRQAQRADLPFAEVMQAELIVLLMA